LELGGHYYAAVGKDMRIKGIAVIKTSAVEGFEIIGMGVRPECKRKGVCTRLLEHVVNVAADSGFKSIEAVVFADNAVMLRLLLSMSFVPAGMDYNRRCDGADTLRMKKVL
jgi:ribosomal protein S18 acetylase RimI-like enzyme